MSSETGQGGLITQGVPASTPSRTNPGSNEKIPVGVVRVGVKPKSYRIPPGVSLGQLASTIGATFREHVVTCGDEEVNKDYILKADDMIFFVPEVKNASVLREGTVSKVTPDYILCSGDILFLVPPMPKYGCGNNPEYS